MEKLKAKKKDLDLSNVPLSNKKPAKRRNKKQSKIGKVIATILKIYDFVGKNFVDKITIKPIKLILKGILGVLVFLTFFTIFIGIPASFIALLWKNPFGGFSVLSIIVISFLYYIRYELDKSYKKEVNTNGKTGRNK